AAGYSAAAARFPRAAAITDDWGTLTFAEVHARTGALADALAREGLGEGDRVALMCRNHRGWVESVIACSKLGAHVLLLNTAFSGRQLAEVVEREGAQALIHDAEFAALADDAPG